MTATTEGPVVDPTTEEGLAKIAQVCHETNRALQALVGDPVSPPWDETSPQLRDSAVAGVRDALAGATPQQLHQSWCDHKTEQGWKLGPVKDEQARTHPCLVPYHLLPAAQRAKDHVFHALVHTLTQENL